MPVKWATTLYRTVLLPSFYGHHLYWRRKVAVDRWLESCSPWTNSGIAIALGVAAYYGSSPFRRYNVDKSTAELNDDMMEIMVVMGFDPHQELPEMVRDRLAGQVASKILVANDRAALRRERAEIEELKALLAEDAARAAKDGADRAVADTAAVPEAPNAAA